MPAVSIITPAIAQAARAAMSTAPCGKNYGAARVYLGFGHKLTAGDRKALDGAGFRLMQRPYCTGKSNAYLGYDNFSGQVFGMGVAAVEAFKAAGVNAYSDYDSD